MPSPAKRKLLANIPDVYVFPQLEMREGMTVKTKTEAVIVVREIQPWVIAHEWVHYLGGDEGDAESIERYFRGSNPGI